MSASLRCASSGGSPRPSSAAPVRTTPRRSSSVWPAASPSARAPRGACCRPSSRAGPSTRGSTSSPPTAFVPQRHPRGAGILQRKGFPESYDLRGLMRFVADVREGAEEASAPVYSHLFYDIVPDERQHVRRPDILILEGLNVLQRGAHATGRKGVYISDYFDFSIYVDAEEAAIREWFFQRFRRLRETAFRDPHSYFHKYASMPEASAMQLAHTVWDTINGVNLRQNIAPTRERADLILEKAADHTVQRVLLRVG
ncbi:type I pantothenate kinase [Nannocystis pusilla]|uniref:type I pantothenate kinase n=1 Tax=Nannocystis pusilla TaxID=889268 RepID=UPI003B7978C7